MQYLPDDEENPFRALEGYWATRFVIMQAAVPEVDDVFDDVALSFSSFEADVDGVEWVVEVLTEHELPMEDVKARLAKLSEKARSVEVTYLKQKDWVSEVQKSFPPLQAGRFFIYGSHYKDAIPAGTTPILIDAGMAFGSGEHETTSGCLKALDDLGQAHRFTKLLDMGCGSGILAVAMAKLWQQPVVAADIDEVAVRVTEENGRINGEEKLLITCTSDGYQHPLIGEHAPYDLIVANILARPLVELAPELAKHLAPGGWVVLSGLLDRQEKDVIAAHEAQGLTFIKRFPQNGWHTLVLRK